MSTDNAVSAQGTLDSSQLGARFTQMTGRPMPGREQTSGIFRYDENHQLFFKRVLYFIKTVVEPLESCGMSRDDSILDGASGNGPLTLALLLCGFHDVAMCDLDPAATQTASRIVELVLPGSQAVPVVNSSLLEWKENVDVLVSYQTIEHLERSGKQRFHQADRFFSAASRSCQEELLRAANQQVRKLIFINAPSHCCPKQDRLSLVTR